MTPITQLLFVDDEEQYRKAFMRAMRKQNQFQVEMAANGLEALELLKDLPTDIVVTDMKMQSRP